MALNARLFKITVLYKFFINVEGTKSTDIKKHLCVCVYIHCEICHWGKGIPKSVLARTQSFR